MKQLATQPPRNGALFKAGLVMACCLVLKQAGAADALTAASATVVAPVSVPNSLLAIGANVSYASGWVAILIPASSVPLRMTSYNSRVSEGEAVSSSSDGGEAAPVSAEGTEGFTLGDGSLPGGMANFASMTASIGAAYQVTVAFE
jgi:hypothetical protein